MNLLEQIKDQKLKEKSKRPFNRSLFTIVSTIVQKHRLDHTFLGRLKDLEEGLMAPPFDPARLRAKEPLEPPLFSLCPLEPYRLTRAIIERVNNPYLKFARSPEEIRLSFVLHQRRPDLPPEMLRRHHFENLFLLELAREALRELPQYFGRGGLDDAVQKKLDQLRQFISQVEDHYPLKR